ncbi:MAG: hypothetical protein REJ24_10735 [Rhodocyclaceae bacterium]|nr:hypothetical protein [Pseudomonadota bacterium]MDQ7973035.1 hypothetical protein [Rhodocyclaceae bacterium]MDQ7998240.1 hypothetical protein [Pseudomonadota bacterium]MDQ8017085.1 hypothetical protein [Pseudomonadota bacterium]
MATHIVDLSARSEVLRNEPFSAHFWECTPSEYKAFLGRPREFLRGIGVELDPGCRIETLIENHDRFSDRVPDFDGDSDEVICSLGRSNAANDAYRVVSYARDRNPKKVKKHLLHKPGRERVKDKHGDKA